MFGCGHSRDNTPPNSALGWEYGYHFKGSNGSGYATMMAYRTSQYPTRIREKEEQEEEDSFSMQSFSTEPTFWREIQTAIPQ